jgi:protein PhnA
VGRMFESCRGRHFSLESIIMDDVRDSNGNELKDGDNVTLIKDLKVKGANVTLKRGTMIKGIRLKGNPDEVDCRHEKVKGLVLRTEFLKKA